MTVQLAEEPANTPSPSRGGPPILRLENINAGYQGNTVVHIVSFAIHQGECVALVAESGSGKTTLARAIGGLHHEWTGDIFLDQDSLANNARKRTNRQRMKMQYVFQNPYSSLNPRRSIGESVLRPLLLMGVNRTDGEREVNRMLELVSLTAWCSPVSEPVVGWRTPACGDRPSARLYSGRSGLRRDHEPDGGLCRRAGGGCGRTPRHLVDGTHRNGVPDYLNASMQGWFVGAAQRPLDAISWWDEHGTEEQRGFQVACLLFGADPDRFAAVAEAVELPAEVASRASTKRNRTSERGTGCSPGISERRTHRVRPTR